MPSFAADLPSYSLRVNQKYFYKYISELQFVGLILQMFQMSEMNFHLTSSDKVSENIHTDKKLPVTIHLWVFNLYLETAETKLKKKYITKDLLHLLPVSQQQHGKLC